MTACQSPGAGASRFRSAPGPIGVSHRPDIPDGLLPSRARFRFTGHRPSRVSFELCTADGISTLRRQEGRPQNIGAFIASQDAGFVILMTAFPFTGFTR